MTKLIRCLLIISALSFIAAGIVYAFTPSFVGCELSTPQGVVYRGPMMNTLTIQPSQANPGSVEIVMHSPTATVVIDSTLLVTMRVVE